MQGQVGCLRHCAVPCRQSGSLADCAVLEWSKGLQDKGLRSTFRGRCLPHLAPLSKAPGASSSLPLRAAACTKPSCPSLPSGGRGAPPDACRLQRRAGLQQAQQPAESMQGVREILFERQVGEIYNVFNQAASFRL